MLPEDARGRTVDDRAVCPELVVDRSGRITACNAALARLVGREPEAIVGRHFEDLLNAASCAIYQSHVLPLLCLRGQVSEFVLTLNGPAGAPTDALLYARVDDRDAAQPFRIALAPYRSRRAIEDELLRIKRAADEAPSLLFQASAQPDGELRIDYVSEAVQRIFGCTAQQARVSPSHVLDRIHPDDLQHFRRPPPAVGEEQRHHFMLRLPRPDGSLGHCDVHAVLRCGPGGRAVWFGQMADVTEHRALAAEAAELRASEQARRTQLEFLGRVSHELRTPLNAILGFSQILSERRGRPSGDAEDGYLDLIHDAGGRLLGLVNDLLDISRLHDSGFEVQLAPVDAARIVRSSLQMQQEAARALGLSLSVEGEPALWVRADARRLAQLVDNLVSNAIKFNRVGGSVRVALQRSVAGRGVVAVADTGVGIAPQRIAALFQPFNRLGAEALGIPGTGLGLAIARQIADRLGAALEVTSVPGIGSTFRITLPLAERPGDAPAPAAAPGSADRADGPPLRVLYIDDDPVNGLLMAAIANSAGHVRLEIATSGQQGLAAALAEPPDLLLVDRHLPDTDGNRLLAEMRSHAALGATPAVMVSADAQPDAQARARDAGFADYWTKPLDANLTRQRFQALASSAPIGPA